MNRTRPAAKAKRKRSVKPLPTIIDNTALIDTVPKPPQQPAEGSIGSGSRSNQHHRSNVYCNRAIDDKLGVT